MVWCKWRFSYMIDADLVAFLKRSQRALRKGGAIGVKKDMREDGEGGILGKRLDPVD